VVNVEAEAESRFVFFVCDSTDRTAVVVAFECPSPLSVPAVSIVRRHTVLDIDVIVRGPAIERAVLGIQRLPPLERLATAGTLDLDLSPSQFPGTVVRAELAVSD